MGKQAVLVASLVVTAGVGVSSLGSLAWIYGKVRAYEHENGVCVLSRPVEASKPAGFTIHAFNVTLSAVVIVSNSVLPSS